MSEINTQETTEVVEPTEPAQVQPLLAIIITLMTDSSINIEYQEPMGPVQGGGLIAHGMLNTAIAKLNTGNQQ